MKHFWLHVPSAVGGKCGHGGACGGGGSGGGDGGEGGGEGDADGGGGEGEGGKGGSGKGGGGDGEGEGGGGEGVGEGGGNVGGKGGDAGGGGARWRARAQLKEETSASTRSSGASCIAARMRSPKRGCRRTSLVLAQLPSTRKWKLSASNHTLTFDAPASQSKSRSAFSICRRTGSSTACSFCRRRRSLSTSR